MNQKLFTGFLIQAQLAEIVIQGNGKFPFCNIQFYYDTVERKIEYQHTGKYERQKLTPLFTL